MMITKLLRYEQMNVKMSPYIFWYFRDRSLFMAGGGWVINYQETHFFKDPPGKNKLNFRIPPTKENYFN